MRSLLVALIVFAICGIASAQVDVRVSLSPPVVPYHKQATFTIVVESPVDVKIEMPDMRDSFGDLEVQGVPDYHSERIGEDRVRITESYLLDPVDVKDHFIPPVEIKWNEDDDEKSLLIPSPMFRVRALTEAEEEEAQRFDPLLAGGPGALGQESSRTWVVVLVALVAIAAVALILLWLRQRGGIATAEFTKPPWEIAQERLATLQARNLPQNGKFETYYIDLSGILRYYIEGRFHVHAPERTTPEFLNEISGEGFFSAEQEVFLARFLRLCDRVKFAQYRPDLEAMGLSFGEVERFVEETVPVEEPEEEAIAA